MHRQIRNSYSTAVAAVNIFLGCDICTRSITSKCWCTCCMYGAAALHALPFDRSNGQQGSQTIMMQHFEVQGNKVHNGYSRWWCACGRHLSPLYLIRMHNTYSYSKSGLLTRISHDRVSAETQHFFVPCRGPLDEYSDVSYIQALLRSVRSTYFKYYTTGKRDDTEALSLLSLTLTETNACNVRSRVSVDPRHSPRAALVATVRRSASV